jgi:hypothetical protein
LSCTKIVLLLRRAWRSCLFFCFRKVLPSLAFALVPAWILDNKSDRASNRAGLFHYEEHLRAASSFGSSTRLLRAEHYYRLPDGRDFLQGDPRHIYMAINVYFVGGKRWEEGIRKLGVCMYGWWILLRVHPKTICVKKRMESEGKEGRMAKKQACVFL